MFSNCSIANKDSAFARNVTITMKAMVAAVFISGSPLIADTGVAIEKITTPAGHTFWYYPMPQASRTALAVSWAQEVPLNDAVHPGVARLGIDVMLNGGAGSRDAADIVADYEDLDAGSGLWVQPRHVSGFIFAPNEHFSKAREIANQVMTAPRMGQRWFDREQQRLIGETQEANSGSWGMAWNLAREVILGEHPYNKFWSMSPLGEFEKLSLDDINQWFESSFSTKTATVTIAGSAAADVVARELDLLFADMPSGELSDPIKLPLVAASGKTIVLHSPDAPKSVVVLLGSVPDYNEETDLPLQLGVGVLGFGKQSRLFKAVRAGLGASYGFGASVFDFTREHRMLQMSGEIETAQLQEALKEIEQAYEKFKQAGIGRIEFPIAKRIFKREYSERLQNPVDVAFLLSESVLNGYTETFVPNLMDEIDNLNRKTTNEVVSSALPAYDDLLKVIVSPDNKAVDGACVISKIEEARGC